MELNETSQQSTILVDRRVVAVSALQLDWILLAVLDTSRSDSNESNGSVCIAWPVPRLLYCTVALSVALLSYDYCRLHRVKN